MEEAVMKLLTHKFLVLYCLQMLCLLASLIFYALFQFAVFDDYGIYVAYLFLLLVYLLGIPARRELSERLALQKKRRLERYGGKGL